MTTADYADELTTFEQGLLTDLLDAFSRREYVATTQRPAAHPRRPRRRTRSLLVALVAGSAIAAGAVAADAILDQPAPVTFLRSQPPSPAVPAVPKAILDSYALFRDQPADHQGDAAPPRADSRAGLNAALARTVATPLGAVTVEPGEDTICFQLADPSGPSGTCRPVDAANRGEMVLASRRDAGSERTRVVGLVPDHIVAVELHEPEGATTRVPVDHNIWTVTKTNANRADLIAQGGNPVGTIDLP